MRRLCAPANGPAATPPRGSSQLTRTRQKELQLFATAAELGFCCIETSKLVKEFVRAIVRRMQPRTARNVYQSVTFTLMAFPLAVAEKLFPESLITRSSHSIKTWTMSSLSAVVEVLAPVMADQDAMVGGVTKALMTASQQWSRVIATVISAEATWMSPSNGGADRLYMNFMYVLADEAGEVHPPKDGNRRELALSESTMTQIREHILSDVALLAQKGVPLSAGWYVQLGLPAKAMEVRALEANIAALQAPSTSSFAREAWGGSLAGTSTHRRARKRQADVFEVDAIVEAETIAHTRGVWVKWVGYSPDWEAWRVEGRGKPGEPLVTWEPERNLRRNEVYLQWVERRAEEAATTTAGGAAGSDAERRPA